MANTPAESAAGTLSTSELSPILGARRPGRRCRVMRQTRLPPEVLLDLAIELLDIASRKLAPEPLRRTAVSLGAARWRHVSPEDRSKALRKAARARWGTHRRSRRP